MAPPRNSRPALPAALAVAAAAASASVQPVAGLSFLAHASPVAATSHQLAIRRVAQALAGEGHAVTLLERRGAFGGDPGFGATPNLTVISLDYMSDANYSARFRAGESYQRLNQEVIAELLPRALHELRGRHFDFAVVDALFPLLARELRLPSLHVQCASDPDAVSAAWFHYGLSGGRRLLEVVHNARFAALWLFSWLLVGTHQDVRDGDRGRLSWGEYFHGHVRGLALQGAPHFALPAEGAALVAASPSRAFFVGSVTARPGAAPASEAPAGARLALVAFGTHDEPCPEQLLRALDEVGLTGVVLVEACRSHPDLPPGHLLPDSRDQAAWLRADGMRLAVVHGGIHSLLEAVAAGLPVACVPHRGDQWANCRDLQRQRLGWAIHPRAPAEEAAAVLRHLLDGGFAPAPAAKALVEGGGAAAVARLAVRLAEAPGDASPPPWPFFAAPLRWAEGWLLLLGALLPLLALAAVAASCCMSPVDDPPADGDSCSKAKAE